MEKNIKTTNFYTTPVITAGSLTSTTTVLDINPLKQKIIIKNIFCSYHSYDASTNAYYQFTSLRVQFQKNSGNLPFGNAIGQSSGNDNFLWFFLNNNNNINLNCNYSFFPGDRITVVMLSRQDVITANNIILNVGIVLNYLTEE